MLNQQIQELKQQLELAKAGSGILSEERVRGSAVYLTLQTHFSVLQQGPAPFPLPSPPPPTRHDVCHTSSCREHSTAGVCGGLEEFALRGKGSALLPTGGDQVCSSFDHAMTGGWVWLNSLPPSWSSRVEELKYEAEVREEMGQLEAMLASAKRDHELLRIEFEKRMASNEQAAPIAK